MASHSAFVVPAALRSDGRPQAPLVDIALVRRPIKAPARKTWAEPKIECDGFIQPKALRPEDFEEPSAFPMRRLIALVAGVSWVKQSDILSVRRHYNAVKARQIVFWLAKHFTSFSYPHIGRGVGDRDHTTALYGVRKVEAIVKRLNIEVTACPVEMAEKLWAADWSEGPK